MESKAFVAAQGVNIYPAIVDGMAALKLEPVWHGRKVLIKSFYPGTPWGFTRLFIYDESQAKSSHDGWRIVNQEHNATEGNSTWYESDGSATDDSGNGCWVREGIGSIPSLHGVELGMKIDDSWDDTTAAQAGIDYLSTTFGGGTVDIGDGTSKCNMDLYSGIQIKGAGYRVSGLKPYSDNHVLNIDETDATVKDVFIEGLTIGNADGSFTTSRGINIEAYALGRWIDRVEIKDCLIDGNAAEGVYVDGDDFSVGNFIQNLSISRTKIQNNGKQGLVLTGKVIETTLLDVFVVKNAPDSPTSYNNFDITINANSYAPSRVRILGGGYNHYHAVSGGDMDASAIFINAATNVSLFNTDVENGRVYLTSSAIGAVSIRDCNFGNNFSMDDFITVHNCNGLIIENNDFAGTRTNDIYFDGAPNRYSGIDIGPNKHVGSVTTPVGYANRLHEIFSGAIEAHFDSITVDGESGDDDLDYIYSGSGNSTLEDMDPNRIITIKRRNDTITAKHATGNLVLSGAADYALDSDDKRLFLRLDESTFNLVEIGRI